MAISTTTGLWIVIVTLAAAGAYLLWQSRSPKPGRSAAPAAPTPGAGAAPPSPAGRGAAEPSEIPRSARNPRVERGAGPATPADPGRRPAASRADRLLQAKSWGYQLQKLNLSRAAHAPFDVLVIDYARDGSYDTALGPRDLERLRTKPDGSQRLVLAYLSIGEAESYRFYWNPAWKRRKPEWLLSENPEWKENFSVCFWDPGWQNLMCGNAGAYLDRIIAAGFDGVYLDKCDVYEDLARRDKAAARSRPDLEGDMVAFVAALSRHAKSVAPGFLVVMQNAEGLLARAPLLAAIDGVAKEELLFGVSATERKNSASDIAYSRRALDAAKAAGKAVLVVEYLDNAAKIDEAARYMARAGYILYIAPKDRELDRLNFDVWEA